MNEININELFTLNGGGLKLSEALIYSAGIVLSASNPYSLGLTVAGIAFTEYQDYKEGI